LSAVGGLQMNVNFSYKMTYEYKRDWTLGQNKPKTNPKQTQFKPCPERIEFTLNVIEGNGPICSLAVIVGFIYILYPLQGTKK